jgi:hypothetical protein
MGGMMGSAGMGAWILVWIVVGLAVAVTAGVVVARALGTRRGDYLGQLPRLDRQRSPRRGMLNRQLCEKLRMP